MSELEKLKLHMRLTVYFRGTGLIQLSKPIFQRQGQHTPAGGKDWSEGTQRAETASKEQGILEAEEERGGRGSGGSSGCIR